VFCSKHKEHGEYIPNLRYVSMTTGLAKFTKHNLIVIKI
jgi:hypothetical protein